MPRTPINFHQVCATYQITTRALRYYEALEILTPCGEGSSRLYDAKQQVRLELLLKARRFRIRLEEARQIIDLYEEQGPEAQAAQWQRIVTRQRGIIQAELAQLHAVEREMSQILEDAPVT